MSTLPVLMIKRSLLAGLLISVMVGCGSAGGETLDTPAAEPEPSAESVTSSPASSPPPVPEQPAAADEWLEGTPASMRITTEEEVDALCKRILPDAAAVATAFGIPPHADGKPVFGNGGPIAPRPDPFGIGCAVPVEETPQFIAAQIWFYYNGPDAGEDEEGLLAVGRCATVGFGHVERTPEGEELMRQAADMLCD